MSWREQKEHMYQTTYHIPYFNCGLDGNLMPASLFRYWTDTSIRQTDLIANDYTEQNGLIWVLYAWTVHVDRMPTVHEDIQTTTFARDFDRFYGYRNFLMEDTAGHVIAQADSIWLLLDLNRKRAVRLVPEVTEPYGKHEPAFVAPKPTLKELDHYSVEMQMTARKSEIDVNRHVNNAAVVDWFFEALDWKFVLDHKLVDLSILYKNQTFFGEEVTVCMERVAKDACGENAESDLETFAYAIKTEKETKVLAELTFAPVKKSVQKNDTL